MNVAMCIPTYKRASVVDEILEHAIDGYTKMGIDLYFYDGSPDDETKQVVEKYVEKGYTNIKYMKFPPEVKRGALMLTGEGFEKQYDYIWPVKDRTWFGESTLIAIEKAMEEEFDVVFLGTFRDYSNLGLGTKTYENMKEFYLNWGFLATSIDVTIYKRTSMLENITYDGYIKDYVPSSFSHYKFLFTHLIQGKKKVRVLSEDEIVGFSSQQVKSNWKKDVFSVWKDKWIEVNETLPEYYNEYKSQVIKQAGMLPWILGSVDALIGYKECGALVPEKLDGILKDWEKVSDIPKEKLVAIANGCYDIKHDIDLVPKNIDEFLNLLIRISELVREGKFSRQQIPYDEIFQCVMEKIMKKYGNYDFINVISGTVEDLLLFIRDKAETMEEINRAFQTLITITIAAL